jgi:hypothetical protein
VHIVGQHVVHVAVGQIALFLARIDQIGNIIFEFVVNSQSARVSCAENLDCLPYWRTDVYGIGLWPKKFQPPKSAQAKVPNNIGKRCPVELLGSG